jgi:hypothetical protein
MSAELAGVFHAGNISVEFRCPARVVANVGNDMSFGTEAGAPFNAGETVTFLACPFTAEYPEQREGQR